jgi:hypothetical protein
MIVQFRRKTTAAAALIAIALTLVVVPSASAAPPLPRPNPITIPVVGTIPTGGAFTGTMTLTSFGVQNGQVVARGLLTGLITNAAGTTSTVISTFAAPVAVTQATCEILHLDLAPLFLNLLGLQVNLSEVVLDLSAVQGAGNLLGNLLCAVTGLLDSPGMLAGLLNGILNILGGLGL